MTTAFWLSLLSTIVLGAQREIQGVEGWKASAGTPAVEMVTDKDSRVLQVQAPFQSQPNSLRRIVLDHPTKLDLLAPGAFALEIQADQPQAISQLTLYFHSGKGWYAASGLLTKPGWQTVRFSKASFQPEEQPGSWGHIDTIRIAAWKGDAKDAVIRLRRLWAITHEVAIVRPLHGQRAAANRIAAMLDELRMGSDFIEETALTHDALHERKVLLLPDHAHLAHEAVAALEYFAAHGGKLLDIPADVERQRLVDLLGRLDASLWPVMVQGAIDDAAHVGHFSDISLLGDFVRDAKKAEALACFQRGSARLKTAQEESAAGKHAQAMADAWQGRDDFVRAYALAQPSCTPEGRAVWNHSGTGAYPGDWDRSAKELSAAGFNMILPNMLWGGLAHYASDVLPRSDVFRRYGDQVAQCVAAAHQHGLEVHVWKVCYNLSTAPKTFVEKMRAGKRLVVSAHGETSTWLCPSNPENFKLELDSLLEVARKYPIDGLHLDYIRYPSDKYCFCDGCRQRFEAESGRTVAHWPEDCLSGDRRQEYENFRCQQITRLVEAVHREARKIRPTLKLSAAVFNSYPMCRRDVGQDWVAWVKAGDLDFLCPMNYTNSLEQFQHLVENQLRLIGKRIPLYPGIGATASHCTLTADKVLAQIHEARQQGAAGFTIFSYQAGTAASILPAIGLGVGKTPAAPPHHPPVGIIQ